MYLANVNVGFYNQNPSYSVIWESKHLIFPALQHKIPALATMTQVQPIH